MRPGFGTTWGELVHGTVEETPDVKQEAEADQLFGAGRSERSQPRVATSERCNPRAGDVNLKVPKLRRQAFEMAIIERYRSARPRLRRP